MNKLLKLTGSIVSIVILSSFYFERIPGESVIRIRIIPVFDNKNISFGNQEYITPAGDSVFIDRFIFYMSSLTFIFDDSSTYKEKDSYHLIDFNKEEENEIRITIPYQKKIAKLEFCIGVDSLMSVSGVYGGDLDPMYGMYWTWNSGYINARLEGRSRSCSTRNNSFEFHIGGYAYPYASMRKVSLLIPQGTTDQITLSADAGTWFRDIKLKEKNSILIPGKDATAIADKYASMFKVTDSR